MKKQVTIILALLCSGILTLNAINTGDTAPNFNLNKLDGGSFNLANNQGKVIMIFVIGYNCPACISSAPSVEAQLVNPYSGNSDFVAIAIDIWNGSQGAVETYQSSSGLTIPILMNGSGFASDYSSFQDRIIIIDKNGKIAFINNSANASSVLSAAKSAIDNALSDSYNLILDASKEVSELLIYPNPVVNNAEVQFNLSEGTNIQYSIFTHSGQLVTKQDMGYYSVGKQLIDIDFNNLNNGGYIIQFTTESGQETMPVIKN